MNYNWTIGLTNFTLTPTMATQLHTYWELLVIANQKMNLTTITEKKSVYYKHFYDALLIANNVTLTSQKICDVGSGAGIPGLVLKICFPNLQLTIIEANGKKCQFLQEVVTTLGLQDVTIVNERAEIFAQQHREIFDIVTARALASLPILSELCLALVKIGGLFIAYKGSKVQTELILAINSIKIMGGKLKNKFSFDLPNDYGQRTILHFQKDKSSPNKYPRMYQQIKHKPL